MSIPIPIDANALRQQVIQSGQDPSKIDQFIQDYSSGKWQPPDSLMQQSQQSQNQNNTISNVAQEGAISRLKEPTVQVQKIQAEQPGVVAESTLKQAEAKQLKIKQEAGDFFEQYKGRDNKVNPQDYNRYKAYYVGLGGNADKFDNDFGPSYVNPRDVHYDIPEMIQARKYLPLIKQAADIYHQQLKVTGYQAQQLRDAPLLGKFFKTTLLAPNEGLDRWKNANSGEIRNLAGAGPGQGFRFNLNELANIVGALPGGYDSEAQKETTMKNTGNTLEKTMGVSMDDIMNERY